MAKNNIKRRHNKTLDLSSVKRYRPLRRNLYEEGGASWLFGDYNGSDKGLGWGQASGNALKSSFSSVENGLSSAGSIVSGVTGIVDSALKNAQIADTTGMENSIADTQNTDFNSASDTTSLLDSWNSINWQDADYTMKDVRGVSTGEMIGNTISAVGSGAMAGAQIAGPWGAVGGAAAGLIGSGIGIFTGNAKARKKAAELNEKANIANQAVTNNFDYTSESLEKQQYKDMLANVAKDGGKIHIKPSKRGTFTAAAKKRGMGVQEFAGKVLANKGNYSSAMVKKAQFAKNAAGWKHAEGGPEKGNPYPENRIRYRQILESIEDKMSEAYNWAAGNGYSEEADDVMTAAFPLLYDYIPNTVFPSDSSNFDHYSRTGRKYSPIMIPDPESRETREAIDAVNSLAPEDFQRFINMGVKGQYMKMLMDSKVRKALPFAKQFLAPVQSWAVPYLDRYMQAADEKYGDRKAMGGNLSTHGTDFSNGMVSIDSGGTHEENPLEGVPMGVDEQGIPNLVEEGEVIYNDYVFSNRLAPKKKELQGVNLSPRYTNWTFAKIAEDMGKESSERPNDPISRRGLEDSMMKLAMIQEAQRARKGKKGTQKLMAYGGRKYAGDTDFDNPYNDPYIGSKEQALEEAELNYYSSKSPEIQEGLRQIRSNNQASDPLPTWMRYMPAAGSAIGAIQSIFQKPDYENADILMQEARDLSRPSVRYKALNNYLTYRPLDRNYYLNQLKGQAGATRRGIMNSGSNAGNVMAGLLAADYNAQNAIGKTLMQMEQYNDAQRQKVAEFNRGTDQYNSQAAMSADAQNAQIAHNRDRLRSTLMTQAAQMREAADTALEATRSANLTNFFDNIGSIGRENMGWNWTKYLADSGAFGNLREGYPAPGIGKNGGLLTKRNRRRR